MAQTPKLDVTPPNAQNITRNHQSSKQTLTKDPTGVDIEQHFNKETLIENIINKRISRNVNLVEEPKDESN